MIIIIANRLQYVLEYLIRKEQVGFMRNRSAADNLIDLLTVIEHCEQNNEAAILTAVDYMKAFDTISGKQQLQLWKVLALVTVSSTQSCYATKTLRLQSAIMGIKQKR